MNSVLSSILLIINLIKNVFSFFKGIKDVFIRHNKNGSINISGTFWTFFLTSSCFVTTMMMAYVVFFKMNNYYKNTKFYSFIENESAKIVNDCGKNSFIFWISFDGLDNLSFVEATGCTSETRGKKASVNCIDRNIKYQNPVYTRIHKIDLNTADLITRTPPNQLMIIKNDVLSEDILEFLKATQEGSVIKIDLRTLSQMEQYNTFANIIKKTNLGIDIIGVTLVKDFKNNAIYAFTLSFTHGAELNCKYPFSLLQDLGFKVKDRL